MMFIGTTFLILALSATTFANPVPRQETSLLSASSTFLTSSTLPASSALPSGNTRAVAPSSPENNTISTGCSHFSANGTSGTPPSTSNNNRGTAGVQARQDGVSASGSPTTTSLNSATPSSAEDAADCPPPANGTDRGVPSHVASGTPNTATAQPRQETSLPATTVSSLSISPSGTSTPATGGSHNAVAQTIDGNNSTSVISPSTVSSTAMASSSTETLA